MPSDKVGEIGVGESLSKEECILNFLLKLLCNILHQFFWSSLKLVLLNEPWPVFIGGRIAGLCNYLCSSYFWVLIKCVKNL